MLILYPATLLNLLIRSNRWGSLEFPLSKIMSSVYRDTFTSSFLILMIFISFSCLIALVMTSRTRLSRSGQNGYPCLVLELSRKAFNLSSLSIILAVGLSHIAFIMLQYIACIPNFLNLTMHVSEIIQCLFFSVLFHLA